MVAQQGQTRYEVFLHAIAGHIHPCCAFGALPVPMAMPGSPGAILALFAHLWAWWDMASEGHPCPSLSHASLPCPPHSQGLPTHYTACHAPTGAAWLIVSVSNYQKRTLMGSAPLWFLHACTE